AFEIGGKAIDDAVARHGAGAVKRLLTEVPAGEAAKLFVLDPKSLAALGDVTAKRAVELLKAIGPARLDRAAALGLSGSDVHALVDAFGTDVARIVDATSPSELSAAMKLHDLAC